MKKLILLLFSFFLSISNGQSQDTNTQKTLKVVDALTLLPVPFANYQWENDGPSGYSDASGRIFINPEDCERYKRLKIKRYQFRDYYWDANTEEDTIRLLRYKFLEYDGFTSPQARTLIEEIAALSYVNDPYHMPMHTTNTYQKLSFGSAKPEALDQFIRKRIQFLNIKLPPYTHPYRLILMENSGKKEVKSKRLNYERITHAQIAGVNEAGALGLPAFWQPYSLYDDEILLAGSSYVGMLHIRTSNLYAFSILDTIPSIDTRLILIKFNPLPNVNLHEKLEGLIWIDIESKAVVMAALNPALKSRSQITLCYEAQKAGKDLWYPYRLLTRIDIPSIGNEPIPLDAENWQYFNSPDFTKRQFSREGYEIAVDFKTDEKDSLLKNSRKEPLSEDEIGTSAFYERLGGIQNLSSYLFVGQRLISGYVPFGKIDLSLHHLFQINDFEGVRLGAGFQTNEKFSDILTTGAYVGYGLQDNAFKGGANIKILHPTGLHTPLHLTIKSDLEEPAMPEFYFYKKQRPSESLRTLRLNTFDRENSISIGSAIHPIKYLDVYGGIRYNAIRPLYFYRFKSEERQTLDWSEFEIEIKYAFNQRFLRFQQERLALRNQYPVIYARFTGTLAPSQSVDYQAVHIRVVHSLKIMGLATIHNQCRIGYIHGSAPFTRLFSGVASFRELSAVSHNSFETMTYNEFLMNRYVTLHTGINFGKLPLAYRKRWTSPQLEWMHSAGWGRLNNPEHHQGISTEDIRKVYLETGINFSNLIILPLGGLNMGIGAGIFTRYGPYAFTRPSDNLVIKVSTQVSL